MPVLLDAQTPVPGRPEQPPLLRIIGRRRLRNTADGLPAEIAVPLPRRAMPPAALDGPNLLERLRPLAAGMGGDAHGEPHWRAVAAIGLALADQDARVDADVVLAFAMIHDALRLDDGPDPEHGRRAARFARTLSDADAFLVPERLALLTAACAEHGEGRISNEPTIAACWDADRLATGRTDPARLSSSTARHPGVIAFTRTVDGDRLRWDEVFHGYAAHRVETHR